MIIGLMGEIGAGKDLTAAYLVKCYGFKRMAFADPLKEVCAALYGVPLAEFHDRWAKERLKGYWGKTPGEMAQFVGTEVVLNNISNDHWIKLMKYHILKSWDTEMVDRNIVITDCRFQNEVDFVLEEDEVDEKETNNCIWTIKRPNNPIIPTIKRSLSHASETQEIKIPKTNHCLLMNNRAKEDLFSSIDYLMKNYSPQIKRKI